MTQVIERLANATFRSQWQNIPDSTLKLNFDVLIDHFGLPDMGSFCLVHWQAKPKGLRRWGVYCRAADMYYAADEILFDEGLTVETLQMDERIVKTVPTAVLFFRDAIAEQVNEKILVRRL
jgi:hypothetical protein